MQMYSKLPWPPEYATYTAKRSAREPLVRFMIDGLRAAHCRIIFASDPDIAPFRITFETPQGERMGVVAYAFLATFTPTKNRPTDEHSFQIKYGAKLEDNLHELWQDPLGLYTTLLIGINPGQGFFVAADPVLHNPTKFFIRMEFKQSHVDKVLRSGWTAWERVKRSGGLDEPVEVLVGGKQDRFLQLVRFERESLGEDQGHRMLLAERFKKKVWAPGSGATRRGRGKIVEPTRIHQLAREFDLTTDEVLDLIAETPRMKMAVRGGVAEIHLQRLLQGVRGVTDCERLTGEGQPDVRLRYRGSRPILLECKNALRVKTAAGLARVDFQRTRASKSDPCSRYYSPQDFDMLAACLHAVTERWEFRFRPTATLQEHKKCPGKLDNNVRIGDDWMMDAEAALRAVVAAA